MQSWLSGEVSIISLGKGNNNDYNYMYRPSYNLQGIITKLGIKLGYSSELHGAWTRVVGHIIDYCSLGYLFTPFAYSLSRNQISLQGYRALEWLYFFMHYNWLVRGQPSCSIRYKWSLGE